MFQRVAPVLAVTAVFLMAADGPSTQPKMADLSVHEWGTFTSVAGENGSAIDWDSLTCPEDLPKFVDRFAFPGFKWSLTDTVRMETPVMYFYSPRELTAHVTVQFPHGLMTEWYPKAQYTMMQNGSPLAANLNGLDRSLRQTTGTIEWRDIKVQPDTSPVFPVESAPSRYYAARQTDAAALSVDGQAEKFLFYRGIARIEVPLLARISGDRILVDNHGSEPVPGVILFEKRGGKLGYRNLGTIKESASAEAPVLDRTFAELQNDLEATLVQQGLFKKEAHAMVETWRESWFEEGSRLLYVVPARTIDALLPLKVEPAPARIARVFVGRIELITPATASAVERAISARDGGTLNQYSRFLEPILERIASGSALDQLRQSAVTTNGFASCR